MILAFNKPYGVLSQFTGHLHRTLSEFKFPPGVYPLGRLDSDSEGLLLLSDEGGLNSRLLNPREGHWREYWAQVERVPASSALVQLRRGIQLPDVRTRPCHAWILDPQPDISPRDPPIRFRKSVETCWLGLQLREGKNRQVRRMTAAVGHPTLRLIRVGIGQFRLGDLPAGTWRVLTGMERDLVFAQPAHSSQ